MPKTLEEVTARVFSMSDDLSFFSQEHCSEGKQHEGGRFGDNRHNTIREDGGRTVERPRATE